jgi:hypothetical protein
MRYLLLCSASNGARDRTQAALRARALGLL